METSSSPSTKRDIIKNIYLYLVSFVALIMMVVSTAGLIDIALRTFIFTKADRAFMYYPGPECGGSMIKGPEDRGARTTTPTECAAQEANIRKQNEEERAAQKQRDIVRDISFILVGIPLFLYHWRIIRKKE